jgi:transposase InsO family protein
VLSSALRLRHGAHMIWKQTNTQEQKKQFIDAYKNNEGDSFTSLCDRFGISRQSGYELVRRFEGLGSKAFEPQSRRPLHSPQAISLQIERKIVALRSAHPTWGPRKLIAYLERQSPTLDWPAPSSVGELLRRRGLTHPRRSRGHTPPFTQPLAHCVAPNDLWCVDFKGYFHTRDGARCNPLTITDASTRMLLRCHHVPSLDRANAQPVFEAAFREYGLPLAIRSDNGAPFATKGLAGLSRLSVWCLRLGVWYERIEPASPQQNGRHERMHRTLKEEVASDPAPNLRLQQRALEDFRHEYNYVRPHEALGQRPPADFYIASPRHFPNRLPEIAYPSDVIVRSVRHNGEIRHRGRTHFLGEMLAGERVALWETESGWDIYFTVLRVARFDARKGRLIRNP